MCLKNNVNNTKFKIQTVVLEGTGTFDLLFTIVGPPAIEIGEQDIPIEYYTTNQVIQITMEKNRNRKLQ